MVSGEFRVATVLVSFSFSVGIGTGDDACLVVISPMSVDPTPKNWVIVACFCCVKELKLLVVESPLRGEHMQVISKLLVGEITFPFVRVCLLDR